MFFSILLVVFFGPFSHVLLYYSVLYAEFFIVDGAGITIVSVIFIQVYLAFEEREIRFDLFFGVLDRGILPFSHETMCLRSRGICTLIFGCLRAYQVDLFLYLFVLKMLEIGLKVVKDTFLLVLFFMSGDCFEWRLSFILLGGTWIMPDKFMIRSFRDRNSHKENGFIE